MRHESASSTALVRFRFPGGTGAYAMPGGHGGAQAAHSRPPGYRPAGEPPHVLHGVVITQPPSQPGRRSS